MGEIEDKIKKVVEDSSAGKWGLNALVGILVTLTASFMAFTTIKGGLVAQDLNYTQGEVNNQWAFYQAKSTKQHLCEGSAAMFRALAEGGPARMAAIAPVRAGTFEADAKRLAREKETIKAKAEQQEQIRLGLQAQYERFCVGEAIFTMAMALFGLTALLRRKLVLAVATGVALGACGVAVWAAASGPAVVAAGPTHVR